MLGVQSALIPPDPLGRFCSNIWLFHTNHEQALWIGAPFTECRDMNKNEWIGNELWREMVSRRRAGRISPRL
jgi:hypothetical protein